MLEDNVTEVTPYNHPTQTLGEDVQGKVIVTIDGDDFIRDLDLLDLTMESSENDILARLRPVLQEAKGVDIMDGGSYLYKVRKALQNQNIYIIPNSTAG